MEVSTNARWLQLCVLACVCCCTWACNPSSSSSSDTKVIDSLRADQEKANAHVLSVMEATLRKMDSLSQQLERSNKQLAQLQNHQLALEQWLQQVGDYYPPEFRTLKYKNRHKWWTNTYLSIRILHGL